MDDKERVDKIRVQLRQAVVQQQDKMRRLGADNPYLASDQGRLAGLETALSIAVAIYS